VQKEVWLIFAYAEIQVFMKFQHVFFSLKRSFGKNRGWNLNFECRGLKSGWIFQEVRGNVNFRKGVPPFGFINFEKDF